MPRREKQPAPIKSHPQHPVYKLREKAHKFLFAQGFSVRAQKSFSTCRFMKQWLVTQTKGNRPCLIPTPKFSTTGGTFSGQTGGSETTRVELPWLQIAVHENLLKAAASTHCCTKKMFTATSSFLLHLNPSPHSTLQNLKSLLSAVTQWIVINKLIRAVKQDFHYINLSLSP